MAKKKTEEKKEETTTKKTPSKPKKYKLKKLFEKASIDENTVSEILMVNGLSSIDEVDIELTESEFEEVIKDYNNKRL